MVPFEGVAIAYLAFFVLAAPFARVARRTKMATSLVAASLAACVYVAAQVLPLEARLWLGFPYIAIGYWIPVPLVPSRRGGAFEAWLRRTDGAVRRNAGRGGPRWLAASMELGYLACFPLVPIAFAAVSIAGSPADVARFWLAVLVAGYACYLTLPWLVSRPARLLDVANVNAELTAFSRANRYVLGRLSHHLNTFPSGHVAVSVAAAIAVARVWPAAGVVLGAVAAAVAAGAVAGRYHYVVDVVLGAAVGSCAAAVS
jgi:membrane-associated phospholipid phosphatase